MSFKVVPIVVSAGAAGYFTGKRLVETVARPICATIVRAQSVQHLQNRNGTLRPQLLLQSRWMMASSAGGGCGDRTIMRPAKRAS